MVMYTIDKIKTLKNEEDIVKDPINKIIIK